jgi:hypothetical protein
LQPNINLESVSENYLLTQPMEIKNPTISGRVHISNGYLVILGMVHDFQCIAIETYESYKADLFTCPYMTETILSYIYSISTCKT